MNNLHHPRDPHHKVQPAKKRSLTSYFKKDDDAKKGGPKRPLYLSFSTQDQIIFAKRLGMILRSGMPIMEGLYMLHDQVQSRSSTFIYKSLILDVSRGLPLSSGLKKFRGIFGEFCINIVRVGETSGTLHENLNYLAEELKKKQTLKRKVVGALMYPAIIVVATIGIAVMLTVYIFPKILPIFQSVKATLPVTTRMLIVISAFLGEYGLWLLLSITAALIGIALVRRLPLVRLFLDTALLHLPLLGRLATYYNLANISRTMSLLLKSDVRIVEAIELVAASTKNHAYRKELELAKVRIIKGQNISTQFKERQLLFPGLFSQMVSVGESTGNLSASFMYCANMYEEEIDELTRNLTSLIEPILMIVMGVIVGFVAISIITPIYSITQSLSPH